MIEHCLALQAQTPAEEFRGSSWHPRVEAGGVFLDY